jgi:hypothetical protein
VSTPTPTTTGTTALPAGAAVTRCETSDLRARLDPYTPPGRAGGSQSAGLGLTNIGDRPCSMVGYPSLQLLDAAGQPRETSVVRAGGKPVRVRVEPGGTAWSVIEWMFTPHPDEENTEPLCAPAPTQARVTPPGESASLLVRADFGRVCRHGEIYVGAMSRTDPR